MKQRSLELHDDGLKGRLVRKDLIDSAGFTVDQRNWTYDPAGNVIERTRSSTTETFAYDALDRLTGQDIAGGIDASWSYAYSPNHNRRSRSNADQRNELYSYQPGTNRLSAIDRFVAQPEPDPPASVQFDYNQAGRLSEYSENGVLTASYTYSIFGLRTRKQAGAVTTVFHYDTGITLLSETDQTGAPVRDYIWLNGSPVATVDAAGNVSYIHTDHLFTPRLATDATGATVWEWAGEAFGDVEPTGMLTLNLRFPGQYFDVESGFHYNVMRDYDPALGRYVQSDPIGLGGGLNTYVYALNNALSRFDVAGLDPGPGIFQIIFPGTTAPFSRDPIGGSTESQIDHARQVMFTRAGAFSIGTLPQTAGFAGLGFRVGGAAAGAAATKSCKAIKDAASRNADSIRKGCQSGMLAGSFLCGDPQEGRTRFDPNDDLVNDLRRIEEISRRSNRPPTSTSQPKP